MFYLPISILEEELPKLGETVDYIEEIMGR
jgi:hypothetical protein